ncbi:MAG: helix-turn-helix domain-containing protein [Burkholderiaceae bacterium]
MSETGDTAAPIGLAGPGATPVEGSPGALLRQARERRGLHIAALAASIKVAPRKLEALEADRYDELPDLTFTRALAQTVCRALKIDSEPVLAKLPRAGDLPRLSRLGEGINAHYREASTRRDPGEFGLLRKPVFWATVFVLLAALALALLPERWVPWRAGSPTSMRATGSAPPSTSGSSPTSGAAAATLPAEAASATGAIILPAAVGNAASAVAAAATALIDSVQALPPEVLSGPVAGPIASNPVAGPSGNALQVKANAASWVEVQDARGTVLLSRSVQAGESLALDGVLPLRLTIGNAAGTQLSFRGAAVDLGPNTRDNVARLQLP